MIKKESVKNALFCFLKKAKKQRFGIAFVIKLKTTIQMKYLTPFFLIICIYTFGQTKNYSGTYEFTFNGSKDSSVLKRTLTLNADGTFLFHKYRKLPQPNSNYKEDNSYGKGTWKATNKQITFYTAPTDLTKKYTYNFNTTKARFHSKSSRDKSNRDVKTKLIIYKSDILILKGLQLIKN